MPQNIAKHQPDRAGVAYWDARWSENLSGQDFVPAPGIRRYPDRRVRDLLSSTFEGLDRRATVVEVGCGASAILPYIGSQMGFQVAGIDYSPVGCESARSRLSAAGLEGEITCADVFSSPPAIVGRFDAAYSFGLVEHFQDTAAIVSAIGKLVRPGGKILTVIPNMNGAVGLVQRLVAPSIFAVHVPVDVKALDAAHRQAGLQVLRSGWFLPIGFGVVNFHEPNASAAGALVRRAVIGVLNRLSMFGWFWNERFFALPVSRLLSPYAYAIARREA